VAITTVPVGPGRLQATLTAQTLPATPANSLQRIAVARIDNATVLPNGAPVGPGASLVFPARTSQATLLIPRQNPAGASIVAFVAADIRGDWPSFVGGGPGAF